MLAMNTGLEGSDGKRGEDGRGHFPSTAAEDVISQTEATDAIDKIQRSGRSLQRGIAVFCVFVVAAIALLVGAVLSAQRQSALDRARFDASNLSAAFETQIRQVVTGVAASAERLKRAVAVADSQSEMQDLLARSDFASSPALASMTGVDGKVIASLSEPAARSIDLSDREHFRIHIGNRYRGMFIGKPVLSRIHNKILIPLSFRLERPDGKFAGVLMVSLPPALLTTLYNNVDLGNSGSLTLVGTDGIIRAYFSRSDPAGSAGEGLSGSVLDSPALHDADFDEEGTYEARGATDGIVRLHHWRKVRGYPLIVLVGLGKPEALLAANQQGAMVLTAGGAAMAVALVMLFMLHREISKRITNEIDLSRQKAKLRLANTALAGERLNLSAANRELDAEKRRAQEASDAKSIFLMNMSHEFRTPMHAILNYTNMSLKRLECGDREKLKKYLENTRSSGLRLLQLLNGLLDLAKLEAGKVELDIVEMDLFEILVETQAELGSLLEEKHLTVRVEVECETPRAMADPKRMAQVVVNLLSNAIKFSPIGGTIDLNLASTLLAEGRAGLRCSVLDRGPGIPTDELGKIFERFSQIVTTGRHGGGTGLGLTICRELIDLHGGRIWAANREGGGAVISFVIPKSPCPPPALAVPNSPKEEMPLPLPIRAAARSV